ncbi:hypothetical protein [Actinoplanes sp. HUAS TT8]|uniref:hypothetical protein n=1 Tax=Actinoplanes sp. HUAS TT8 TaxID=3447453 RepID=UPI003F523E83
MLLALSATCIIVGTVMLVGRKFGWSGIRRQYAVSILAVSFAVSTWGIIQLISEGAEKKREQLARTCTATGDYIDAAFRVASLGSVSGGKARNTEEADKERFEAIGALTSAANESESDQAKTIARQFSAQKTASIGYAGKNDGEMVRLDIEAGRTLRKMVDLCRDSGNEVSTKLPFVTPATASSACAFFFQFQRNNPHASQATDRQHEQAAIALEKFTYHAEFSGDGDIRAEERLLYESLGHDQVNGNPQEEIVSERRIADLCASRGYPDK